MADTDRTTITLAQFYMDCVENCIGILGTSRTQVISKIVEIFFNKLENLEWMDNIRKKRKIDENRKLDPAKFDEKIRNFLKIADNIPLNEFIDFLNIDMDIARKNLHFWAEKFDFRLDNQRIVKNK